jgi:hypothetical protein
LNREFGEEEQGGCSEEGGADKRGACGPARFTMFADVETSRLVGTTTMVGYAITAAFASVSMVLRNLAVLHDA